MKNYYIIICLTPTTTIEVESFIEANKHNFYNRGGNNQTLEKIPTPNKPEMECYRFELSETRFKEFESSLINLNAEMYESAAAYLLQYPPIEETEI